MLPGRGHFEQDESEEEDINTKKAKTKISLELLARHLVQDQQHGSILL